MQFYIHNLFSSDFEKVAVFEKHIHMADVSYIRTALLYYIFTSHIHRLLRPSREALFNSYTSLILYKQFTVDPLLYL